MVWVMTVLSQGQGYRITLPKKWVIENLDPDERLMFMVETGRGHLEVYTEKEWYKKKLGADIPVSDSGTGEACQRATRKGLDYGAGREHEEARTASADSLAQRR